MLTFVYNNDGILRRMKYHVVFFSWSGWKENINKGCKGSQKGKQDELHSSKTQFGGRLKQDGHLC